MSGARSQLELLLGCALWAHACTFLNEPPPESEIDAYFDSVERCQIDRTGIACCSRSSGTLASGLLQAGSVTDWSRRSVPKLSDDAPGWVGDESYWSSQHSLQLAYGAALELKVERERSSGSCDTADPWNNTDGSHATVEIFGELMDPTSTWVSYSANGRLRARLAGEDYDECLPDAELRIHADLRPGSMDDQDVVLGSVGIQAADSVDPRDVVWLQKDVSLGPVRAFSDAQQVRLISKGQVASPEDVWQYQGTCASASVFEPLRPPLDPKQLGAEQWAATLGEAALVIAPALETTPQQSWELLFSGERLTEAGVARRRSIGYSKSFADGEHWVSVPSETTPLVDAHAESALGLDPDYREPSLALSKPGERIVAYTAGREVTHLEVGRLLAGEMQDVVELDAELTRGACRSLSQPALVKQDEGYLLYFTCCADQDHECGSGAGDDTLWLARLHEDLQLDSDNKPRRVEYDRAGENLLRSGRHIVSAEPIDLDGEIRMWLVVQEDPSRRVVMLARSGAHPHEFSFHTAEPVLYAEDLCPGPEDACRLESVAVARAPGEYSVRVAALVTHVGEAEPRQALHLLRQSLEVPW